MGHKRLAIEAGEDPVNNPIEYILDCIKTIYSIHHKNGAIRRVNVNIAATTVENYRRLKEAGIGTYILFQETYNKESYLQAASHRPQARLRLSHRGDGPRHGGRHRRCGAGRAVRAGELYHTNLRGCSCTRSTSKRCTASGRTPSACRASSTRTTSTPDAFDNGISRRDVCQDRRLHPYGCALYRHDHFHPRERSGARKGAAIWAFPRSAARRAHRWAAIPRRSARTTSEQFDVSDQRTLDEVVHWLMEMGYIPSFCTACYREGRTGDRFMSLCKSGADSELLPSQRADDADGIPRGLRKRRDEAGRL